MKINSILSRRLAIVTAIVFLIGGIVYAFLVSQRFRSGDPETFFSVQHVELKRDVSNAILTLQVLCDNRDSSTPVSPVAEPGDPNQIRLETGSSDQSSSPALYVLPDTPPPSVPAGKRATISLSYWLEPEHLADELVLRCRGEAQTVKDRTECSIEAFTDGRPVVLTRPKWNQ